MIEVHDVLDPSISEHLLELFGPTHEVTRIDSVDDVRKAQTYDLPQLEGFDLNARRVLVMEDRPAAMEWFFLTSRV